MNTAAHLPLVELTRGNLVESIHYGSVALADIEGPVSVYGDGITPFFLRSSAKPFQALALLEHDGAKIFNLTLKEVAILCSSHSGTDEHVAVLQKLQKKIGIREKDLQCGIQPPLDKRTQEQLLLRGEKPTPLRHNCSGKHTGMLALAKILGAPLESYLSPDHPVQQIILQTISEMCSFPVGEIHLGIDGCSAPVFAIPLPNAAIGFARLANGENLSRSRANACRLICQAMSSHAEMVAGAGRFDTVFMKVMEGRAICKFGAEGYLGIGIPCRKGNPKTRGLGIAIKISDGDPENRAAPLAGLEVLYHLGLLKADDRSKLADFDRRDLMNWGKLKVGVVRPSQGFSESFAHDG